MSGRREQILATAAELFARHGFHGVSIADLGQACGVSGPALYKHFRSKDAILAEMLVAISEELLTVGRMRARSAVDDRSAVEALIAWHVDFALAHQPLIIVQDRDWAALPDDARERVRSLQRAYVELWVRRVRRVRPDLRPRETRAMVHATFGLLNSTPHSGFLPPGQMAAVLAGMATKALAVD